MKTSNLNRPWRMCGRAMFDPRSWGAYLVAASLLAAASLAAQPQVSTLTGGPSQFYPQTSYGTNDGDTATVAKFHTPYGIAFYTPDGISQYLFVADRDNNAIRELDLGGNQTFTFTTTSINKPVGVAVDGAGNVFVLNRGNGNNGTVLKFDTYGDLLATQATSLTNAAGIALDPLGNIYLTVRSNVVIKIDLHGNQTNVATVPNAGASLQGIVFKHNGSLAVCDSGRNGIYLIDPSTGIVTTNTGFNGAGDYTGVNNHGATKATAQFNQPYGVTEAGDGTLVVSDFGNHRVKVVNAIGTVTNLYGVSSNYWVQGSPSQGIFPGWCDSGHDGAEVHPVDDLGSVEGRLPVGVVLASDGTVYVTEDYYHLIRKVTGAGFPPPLPPPPAAPTILTVTTNYGQVSLTWSTVAGTNITYNVKRSPSSGGPFTTIASTTATSYTDTSVINGTTDYYVVSASNAGGEGPDSAYRSATPPIPPPPAPRIGWFDYEGTPVATTVLHPVSGANYYTTPNDLWLAIDPNISGVSTYYTTDGSAPSPSNGSTPPVYQNSSPNSQPSLPVTPMPDLTIKAVNVGPGGSSAIVTAEFIFQVGNPIIIGNNAAQFTISDITANAHLYYTLDNTDPSSTNGVDLGTVATPTNVWTVSLSIQSNTWFKVRAFRDNYQPSAVVSNLFSSSNFVANTISFGFASGEASSGFVGAPGQTFYAPVTLSVLPNTLMYSLQFNITVTNGGAATNAGPAITPGAFNFQSMLMKPVVPIPTNYPPGFALYTPIPTYMFVGGNFTNLEFTNSSLNLLGVGWLERYAETNLYDTLSQDLIQFSMAHDDLFRQSAGSVIVGGYGFTIPGTATSGNQYQIQIGRPSATDDGVGAPGSSVYIDAPTNAPFGRAINALKVVTVGQIKYLVGSVYPFRWFNAGDFGTNYIVNADVEQVFEAAIYKLNSPAFQAPGSDFFDAMDSCGSIGAFDSTVGYYTNAYSFLNTSQQNALFNGDDTTINQIAFGDDQLDVCDVYVTFRRSLDPSLTWFRRFWTNGIRAAEITTNVFRPAGLSKNGSPLKLPLVASKDQPVVNFTAADSVASAGQTIQIPITAQIFGAYPLRVLMLNLTVEPLDGSPALTSPVQFTPNAALGQPTLTSSIGNGNYAATWLDSTIGGLTSNALVGTLTITIPANASGSAAYAIHFDHASASPNGIASFPKKTLTGLITLGDRSASSYNDGIPDSWRLRYFGTVYNLLSQASADADGDGMNNWQEYIAGTDPTDPASCLTLAAGQPAPSQVRTIRWPSVAGKQYVIEHAPSLFATDWTAVSTNSGTGTVLEFDDNTGGNVHFYRVRVAQ